MALWGRIKLCTIVSSTKHYQQRKGNMPPAIPSCHFDEAFLSWFRERTEAAWSKYPPVTLEQYPVSEIDHDWQEGTRWLHGLTEAEIVTLEKRWNISFPPDYRLFLSRLHAPDRPQAGIYRDDDKLLKLYSVPSFFNWQKDEAVLQNRYDALWDWPGTETERKHLQELVQAAPKLLPINGNRYLLAEPCQEGNPVLSISHFDMIVYAANFRDYLIKELLDVIDKELYYRVHEMGGFEGTYDEAIAELSGHYGVMPLKLENYFDIPFWGECLAVNARST